MQNAVAAILLTLLPTTHRWRAKLSWNDSYRQAAYNVIPW
jgi:hypothetical protein